MVYEERNAWVGLVVSVIGVVIYSVVVLGKLGTTLPSEIDWVAPMIWMIGVSIAVSILVSILWGIVAGARDPDGVGRSDVRDREISHLGDRVGQAFLVISGVVALVLCAGKVDWFWIAQTVFFGFAVSAIVGGTARVIVYRRGMP